MAFLKPWRSESSENLIHRGRTSQVDYINYIHPDYTPVSKTKTPLELKVQRTESEDIEYYMTQLRRILEGHPKYGTPPEPSLIVENLYIGTTSNADNLALLRRYKFKYLFNCAGFPITRPDREMRHYKNPESPVEEYEEMNIETGELYDITRHFLKAHNYLEHARKRGRVLVYCPDVDRSGAICISYLIRRGYSLLQAAKMVKNARKCALFNKGFMKRLVVFARDRGVLDKSMSHKGAMQFEGLMKVKERPRRSHILSII